MHTTPCGTMRRSRFFLNSFLRLLGLAAAGAPAASCGSFAKFCSISRAQPQGGGLSEFSLLLAGHHFLLGRNCALARALAGARIGVRPLAADREVPPVAQPAITLNFNQPANVHLHLFAKIALDAALRFNRLAQAVNLLLREILDLLCAIDLGLFAERTRARLPDPVNRGQADPQALLRRQIYTSNACHVCFSSVGPNPGAACASG